MVVVLLAAMVCVVALEWMRRPAAVPSAPVQQAIATLDKAAVPLKEIEAATTQGPTAEEQPDIAAPDASFRIARPPAGWTVQPLDYRKSVADMIGAGNMEGLTLPSVSAALQLEFGPPLVWSPDPGRTRINGRLFPLLLADPLQRVLRILSLARRQPPLYIDRTLNDVVISQFGLVVSSGFFRITGMQALTLPRTSREMIVVEGHMELEQLTVANQETQWLRQSLRLTAIRGGLYDYLFIASNCRLSREIDAEADRMNADVAAIFDSFRLLSAIDAAGAERRDAEQAEANFAAFIGQNGRTIFTNQLQVALARLADMDLRSLGGLGAAVAILRPFRTFAVSLGEEDPLWDAVDKAEGGDANPLREMLLQLQPAPEEPAPPPALDGPPAGV